MYDLRPSGVRFDAGSHRYFAPDGTELRGITGMLRRQLFPDKYSGVPESVLSAAAERGTLVHEACEVADCLGEFPDIPEARGYRVLKLRLGLEHAATEYTVTDGRRFASNVDKVYRDGPDSFALADIKTTRSLDREYVRWQLSVYARLFGLVNPGARVSRLLAIWLRGDRHEAEEVDRVPDASVDALLDAEAGGRTFRDPLCPTPREAPLPARWARAEASIAETDAQCRYWTARRKALTEGVGAEMREAGVSRWTGGRVSFTLRADSERREFDAARFAEDHPGLYAEYLTTRPVRGGVSLRVREEEGA